VRTLLPLVLLLSLLVTGAPAGAQTSGPTATPVPGSAAALLAAMRSALVASGTVHAVLDASGAVPNKVTFSTEVIADVSFQDGALHSATSSVRTNLANHTSTSERSELKVTGGKGAWRVPHMQWQCEKLLPGDVSGELLAFQALPASAKIAGTGTLNGIAIWKVTGKAIIAPWTGPRKLDSVTFYIAQTTGLPLQITTHFTTRWDRWPAKETLVERYSNMGAPLSISLPQKCR
jgi:hypothetical protein